MNWLLFNSGKCGAAFNMGLDEALLEHVARLGQPALRFYGWTEPAASFGYFQKFSEVEAATKLRPLVRRPTGGGIVPHDADWTYSVVAPPGHAWHSLNAAESYRRIHEWIQRAFAALAIETALAPDKKSALGPRPPAASAACFVGHEKFDLLWHGQKIAGAAQRRNKLGLLIQGSVQPPPPAVSRGDWEQAMLAVGAAEFKAVWQGGELDAAVLAAANQLASRKFSRNEYNQKR